MAVESSAAENANALPLATPVTAPQQPARDQTSSLLAWALLWLLILSGVYYFVPTFVDRLEYAFTRGRLRAEHELAKQALEEGSLEGLSQASQLIFQRMRPSVVHIEVASRDAQSKLPENHPYIPRSRDGQGSGVIIDSTGFIVTNYHVIRNVADIRVTLSDGRQIAAEVVGTDPETDLAVLHVHAEGLIAATWGDSDRLNVGAMVWAMGSPFGLHSSVTSGIVSAKHRGGMAGTPYQDFLQTDCAVNPGSSGGPLIDSHGELVGINSAIVGESYQGISFAIPARVAKEITQRIRSEGKVARGWLGIRLTEVSPEIAASEGLTQHDGAVVADFVSFSKQSNHGDRDNNARETADQSPAEKAGLQIGDVVLRWNDQPITKPATLTALVAATEIGTPATVVVRRAGQELTFTIHVGTRPEVK